MMGWRVDRGKERLRLLTGSFSFFFLRSHGCKACGSNPIESGNDVSTGEVTANYVSAPPEDCFPLLFVRLNILPQGGFRVVSRIRQMRSHAAATQLPGKQLLRPQPSVLLYLLPGPNAHNQPAVLRDPWCK